MGCGRSGINRRIKQKEIMSETLRVLEKLEKRLAWIVMYSRTEKSTAEKHLQGVKDTLALLREAQGIEHDAILKAVEYFASEAEQKETI